MSNGKIVAIHFDVRRKLDGFTVSVERIFVAADLRAGKAEIVPGVGVILVERNGLATTLNRLVKFLLAVDA